MTTQYNLFREPTSGFTHLAAGIASIPLAIWLIYLTRSDFYLLLTMLLYGFGAIFVFMASALYHLVDGPMERQIALRRVDQVGINLMIAGTYTPFCHFFLDGPWRVGMLLVMWALSVGGSFYLIFRSGRPRKFGITMFYMGMGSIALFGSPYFISLLPPGAVALMLAGGASYLVGALVFLMDKPNFHRYFNAHDLWHIFVIFGSLFFFLCILFYIAMA